MEPLRAVLVGCGRISAAWLNAARDLRGLVIVGLMDIHEAAARGRAAQYGLSEAVIGTDLDAVLARVQPDLLFDCTAPEAHAPTRLTALRHGCHVLGEKPLAETLDGARRIIAVGQATGKQVAVTQNRRYHPFIRRLRALVATDALGPLTTVNADHYMGNHFGGFREEMAHPLLLDMAIHTFDAARFLTGTDPVSVFCKEWNPAGSWYAGGASAVAVFEMTGGLVFTYRGSWCAEGVPTSPDGAWRLVGTRGSAVWDGESAIAAQCVVEGGRVATTGDLQSRFAALPIPESDPALSAGGHAAVLREFVHCVRTGETPETVAADNIRSLAMALAAVESAAQGQPVAVHW